MSGIEARPLPRSVVVIAPALFIIALVAIWQGCVSAFHIPLAFSPSPREIWAQLHTQHHPIWVATLGSGWNALRGLLIGAFAGLIGALAGNALRFVREMAAPLVLAASVTPIAALAPVLYGMFGGMFNTARVLVAAVAVAVPVYVNTLRGLQQVLPVHRELMHAYSAGGWRRARTVTLPTALPYLFTGLRIGSSLAVISAVIAEYFGGTDNLSAAIRNSVAGGQPDLAWAYVVGAIVLGLAFYLATYALERWFSRHQRHT